MKYMTIRYDVYHSQKCTSILKINDVKLRLDNLGTRQNTSTCKVIITQMNQMLEYTVTCFSVLTKLFIIIALKTSLNKCVSWITVCLFVIFHLSCIVMVSHYPFLIFNHFLNTEITN